MAAQLFDPLRRMTPCCAVRQAPVVASAVLVSAVHLLQWNAEIVKRWSNEIQEAVQSKNGTVQARNLWPAPAGQRPLSTSKFHVHNGLG